MIDLLRGCLIKKDSINEWDSYPKNIDKFPYVKKYLEPLLRKWIKSTSNPLAIEWVVLLLTGGMERSEEAFKGLEDNLGEDNLRKVLNELENSKKSIKSKKEDADQISIKIASLWGEILVYSSLKERYGFVEKMEKTGDWLCNGSIIISVKTKLDLDLNYELIENSIRSLFYLKENDAIGRRYSIVSLMRPVNIDHAFRQKINWFIEKHLSDSIIRSDKLMYSIDSIQEELLKRYDDKEGRSSMLTVKLTGGIYNGVRQIVAIIREKRTYDQNEHSMEIYFKQSKNDLHRSYYMSQKLTDSWWGEPKIDEELLRKWIEGPKERIDIDYKKAVGKRREFVGWININLHPRYQDYFTKSEVEIQKALDGVLKGIDYKVFVSFALSRPFKVGELRVFEIG